MPERALHGDKIYLMNDENRLEMRSVQVSYRRDNQVIITGDLQQGEKVILNDILPAIEGMLVRESIDEASQ